MRTVFAEFKARGTPSIRVRQFHVVQANGAAFHHAAREHGVRNHDECVERIAVLAQGAVDVAVVIRVAHGGEQGAVQEHATGLVVHFVLVLGAARDLHHDVEGFCHCFLLDRMISSSSLLRIPAFAPYRHHFPDTYMNGAQCWGDKA